MNWKDYAAVLFECACTFAGCALAGYFVGMEREEVLIAFPTALAFSLAIELRRVRRIAEKRVTEILKLVERKP